MVGDVLGKWGTPQKDGYTEYEVMTKVRVLSNVKGVVQLNCPVGMIGWWGDITARNEMMYMSLTERTRVFSWEDVGVHTVLHRDEATHATARARLIASGFERFGKYYDDSLLKKYIYYNHHDVCETCHSLTLACYAGESGKRAKKAIQVRSHRPRERRKSELQNRRRRRQPTNLRKMRNLRTHPLHR
jgi:hypothetical protein